MLVILLIFAISMPIISSAINLSGNKEFFSSVKTEASKGETVTMGLNLSTINYEDFEFTLTSNTNLKEITTEQEDLNAEMEENKLKQ